MHQIAAKHLEKHRSVIDYKVGSFLDEHCFKELETYDIVVCMQSIHEVRDKTLAVDIYRNITKTLKPNGYFLICDFVLGDPGMKDETMYMTEVEQKEALMESGFQSIKLITSYAGLTLYSAQKVP